MYKVDIKDHLAFCTNTETKEVYKLELIKSHSEFGNIWIFSNILNMPYMRKAMFDLISQYETIGVDKKEVIMETQKGMNLINDSAPQTEVYTILSNLNVRAKDIWDYRKTSIALVGLLCVKESELETIGTYEQSISEVNINQWQKDSALFDFFFDSCSTKNKQFLEYVGQRYSILFPKTDGADREHKGYIEKAYSIIENTEHFQDLILSCSNGDIIQRDRMVQYSVSKLYNDLQNFVIKSQAKTQNTEID